MNFQCKHEFYRRDDMKVPQEKHRVEIQSVEILQPTVPILDLIVAQKNKANETKDIGLLEEYPKSEHVESWLSTNFVFMGADHEHIPWQSLKQEVEEIPTRKTYSNSKSEIPAAVTDVDPKRSTFHEMAISVESEIKSVFNKKKSHHKSEIQSKAFSQTRNKNIKRSAEFSEDILAPPATRETFAIQPKERLLRKRAMPGINQSEKVICKEILTNTDFLNMQAIEVEKEVDMGASEAVITKEGFQIDKKIIDKYLLIEVVPGVYRSFEGQLEQELFEYKEECDVADDYENKENYHSSETESVAESAKQECVLPEILPNAPAENDNIPIITQTCDAEPINFEDEIDAQPVVKSPSVTDKPEVLVSGEKGHGDFQANFHEMLFKAKTSENFYPYGTMPKIYRNPNARQVRSKRTTKPHPVPRKRITIKMPPLKMRNPEKVLELRRGEPYEVLKLDTLVPTYDIFDSKWNKTQPNMVALNESRSPAKPKQAESDVNWDFVLRKINNVTSEPIRHEISLEYNHSSAACVFRVGCCLDLQKLTERMPKTSYDQRRKILIRHSVDPRSKIITCIWHCGKVLIINCEDSEDAQFKAYELVEDLERLDEHVSLLNLRVIDMIECTLPWSIELIEFCKVFDYKPLRNTGVPYVDYVSDGYEQAWVRIYENGQLNLFAPTYSMTLKLLKHLYATLADFRVIV